VKSPGRRSGRLSHRRALIVRHPDRRSRRRAFLISGYALMPIKRPRAARRRPMDVLARGIKHLLDMAIQGPHDANPREHCRPAGRRDQDQRFHSRKPFRRLMLGLRAKFP
jgi:hypothetical protein